MYKYQVELLVAAWQDIDKISDFHLKMVGTASAEKITNRILDTLAKLSTFPYMGAQHPDPKLAQLEYRKVICEDYVCIYKIIAPMALITE